MKHGFKDLMDGQVVTMMTKFVAQCREHTKMSDQMDCICPNLTTRWVIMGKVSKWLLEKRIQIVEYSDSLRRPLNRLPPDWWWVIVAGIKAVTEYVNPVFVKLQGRTLLVSQQTAILAKLADDLSILVGMEGPFDPEEILAINAANGGFNSTYGRWSIPHGKVLEFLNDQGMYIRHTLDSLEDEWHQKVIEAIGNLLVTIVEGIRSIQAERDGRNNAAEDLPPVLPHELVKLRTAEFGRTIVDPHLVQLRQSWDEETIAQIEEQHRLLYLAYRRDTTVKSALDNLGNDGITVSFEVSWALVGELGLDVHVLRDFCGGIATVPANTATVESDFSILGWEKDEYRKCLSDLALEGIMHSKQYDLLSTLDSRS